MVQPLDPGTVRIRDRERRGGYWKNELRDLTGLGWTGDDRYPLRDGWRIFGFERHSSSRRGTGATRHLTGVPVSHLALAVGDRPGGATGWAGPQSREQHPTEHQ